MNENPHKGHTGLSRIFRAMGHSAQGLAEAYRHESAFRQEIWLAVVLSPGAFVLANTWSETALLLGSLALVLITELLNSAVEAAIDRISFELHPLSKRAKDLGSAAVLLSLVLCSALWITAAYRYLTG